MKTARILTILVVALGLIVCQAKVSEAAPIGTAFTYQGHLYDANYVADGLYDFQFKLYDANTAGSQVGGDVNKPDVDVITGHFTVELDFGAVFEGDARWLEIGVRPGEMNDPNVYTTLSPRQEVTPTPYALYAAGVPVPLELNGSVSSPGAVISGTNTGSGYGLRGEATGSTGRGVYGKASGSTGKGMWGEATDGGNYTNYGGYFTAAGSYAGASTAEPLAALARASSALLQAVLAEASMAWPLTPAITPTTAAILKLRVSKVMEYMAKATPVASTARPPPFRE